MALATFAAGAAVSSAIDFGPRLGGAPASRFLAVRVQSGTWTSAACSIQVSEDGTNFYPLRTGGNLVSVASIDTTNLQYVEVPYFRYYRLWSNTSGSNTNQVNAMVIDVVGT